jgi:hypothetical protein
MRLLVSSGVECFPSMHEDCILRTAKKKIKKKEKKKNCYMSCPLISFEKNPVLTSSVHTQKGFYSLTTSHHSFDLNF